MRDLQKELDQSLGVLRTLEETRRLQNAVLAMLVLCIPVLTISTVLWQWLG